MPRSGLPSRPTVEPERGAEPVLVETIGRPTSYFGVAQAARVAAAKAIRPRLRAIRQT